LRTVFKKSSNLIGLVEHRDVASLKTFYTSQYDGDYYWSYECEILNVSDYYWSYECGILIEDEL
jgi:hypothetical protein